MTKTEISNLLGRNRSANRIGQALNLLLAGGRVRRKIRDRATKGEGVVACGDLPRNKAKRGALQGHRGGRKRPLPGPRPRARRPPPEGRLQGR